MADRAPNQDPMRWEALEPSAPEDDEEVRDLGFIVEDHTDRRGTLHESWQRLDDLDTDEPLETNRSGDIPHAVALREAGSGPDAFPTDYHIRNAPAEDQEEDFLETSMLAEDPEANAGAQDFTDETLGDLHGHPLATDLLGRVPGVADGLGASVPQDLGRGGFQIEDNPLVQTPFDRALISAREHGQELDDYDDDQQEPPRARLDLGADDDMGTPGDPSLAEDAR